MRRTALPACRGLLLALLVTALSAADDEVCIAYPDRPLFARVASIIAEELPQHHPAQQLPLTAGQSLGDVLPANPGMLICLDNPVIEQALALRRGRPALAELPLIVGLGLNLRHHYGKQAAIAGVAYEMPLYNIVSEYSQLSSTPIHSVLTFYRGSQFTQSIADSTRQLERIGVQLKAIDVEAEGPDRESILRTIRRLAPQACRDPTIDAVVLLNDNAILNEATLPLWQRLAQRRGLPFLGSLDRLIGDRQPLCVYAAIPDHLQIGSQIAQLAGFILQGEASPAELGIEPLISIDHIIHLTKARELSLQLTVPSRDDLTIRR